MIAVGAIAAAVLGLIVYRIQRKWYRDDHDSVSITALVIALLTAIPVPITCLLSVSAGIARVMNWLGKKRLAKSKSKFIKLHAQVTRQFIVPTGLPVCLGSNT